MTKTVRAAIYNRISIDRDSDHAAVTRQNEDALKKLAELGFDLYDTYIDNGKSASRREVFRPEYERMREDYKAGMFTAIITWNLDRLTRQPTQLESWIEEAETRGLNIMTMTGDADLGTHDGRTWARVKVSISKGESESNAWRRTRANIQKRVTGQPTPGRRPYGYKQDMITPEPDEAKVIKLAYRYVAAGGSSSKLVRYFNTKGVLSPDGASALYSLQKRREKGETVTAEDEQAVIDAATPWTTFKLNQLLGRKRNYGVLEHRGIEQPVSRIEPIVSQELFEAVQAILADRSMPGRPVTKHLLSGLVFCNECGARMGSKQLKTKGGKAPHYVCSTKLDRNFENDGKRHPAMRADLLENLIRDHTVSAFLFGSKELFPSDTSIDIRSLHEEHTKAQQEVDRLVAGFASGVLEDAEARRVLPQARNRVKAASVAIEEAYARQASTRFADIRRGVFSEHRVSIADAAEVKSQLRENYDALDFDQKRSLIKNLLEVKVGIGYSTKRVYVTHRKVTSLNEESGAR